jgi:hypothetical protein
MQCDSIVTNRVNFRKKHLYLIKFLYNIGNKNDEIKPMEVIVCP